MVITTSIERRRFSFWAASILVRCKNGRSRGIFLALSRDVGTVRVHRDSTALCRCKSGTGPRPCITSASPSIVLVIAALDYIMCSLSRDNDDAHARCGTSTASCEQPAHTPDKYAHTPRVTECAHLSGLCAGCSHKAVEVPQCTTSCSVVSDGDTPQGASVARRARSWRRRL